MNCFDCLSSAEDRTGKNTSSPMWSSSQHPETASKTVIEWNRNTDGVRLTKETTVENYCQSISQAFIPFGDTRLSFQQGRNYWQYLSVKALLLWDFPSCPDIKKNEFIMVIDSRQNGKKKMVVYQSELNVSRFIHLNLSLEIIDFSDQSWSGQIHQILPS